MGPRHSADVWEDAADALAVRQLDPAVFRRLVVVAAHPADDTLGAGGLLRAVAAAGGTVELVLAGDGAAAPGRQRWSEVEDALAALDVPATVHRLGMADPALDEQELTTALAPLMADADAWAGPWRDDPHPDHATVGRACRAAAPVTAHGFGFPIRARTRIDPTDPSVPWDRGYRLVLAEADRAAKIRAVAAHTSRTTAPPGATHAVLSPATLEHFHGSREIYFREPPEAGAPAELFAERYRGDADPWRVRSSWWEHRKRDVLLAALPREHYRLGAEPGCGPGGLTRELAGRCRRLVASDVAAEAVAATTAATAGSPGVEVYRSDVDGAVAVPAGADLVVLSDVLHYLLPARIDAVLDRVAGCVPTGGDVVLVHRREWPAEAPTDARAVHRRICEDDRFTTVVEHVDDDLLLHVVRRD